MTPHPAASAAASAIRIETYRESAHYALLLALWELRAEEPAERQHLPGDARPGHGVLALDELGNPLACGFVYATGTALWLGPHYLMANALLRDLEGGKALASAAVDAVVEALLTHVARNGGGVLHTFTDQPAVIARARRFGFQLRGKLPLLGRRVAAQTFQGGANG